MSGASRIEGIRTRLAAMPQPIPEHWTGPRDTAFLLDCLDLTCRCVWHGERCRNRATQEDGLCNWCGNGRTDDQQRGDPKAVIGPDGEFFGIGGAGQAHDGQRIPGGASACWYSNSGRVIADAP